MTEMFLNKRIIEDKYSPYNKFLFYEGDYGEPNKLLFLGFENEVLDNWKDVCENETDIDLETICNCFLRNLIVYKYEYSCKEIISHPFTLGYLKQNEVVFRFLFDFLASKKKYYPIPKSAHLGMHIHINSSFLNNKEKINLAKFIYDPINLEFLKNIAETNQNRLGIYARFNKDFCPKSEKTRISSLWCSSDDKCYAVHFREEIKTIEFRFFHATNSYATFLKNIEFVHCLANFCKEECFDNMKYSVFKKYLRKNKNYYPNIFKFIYTSSVIGKKG